jgi:uncharacterized protein
MSIEDIFSLSRRFLEIKNKPYKRYFIQTTPLKQRLSILLGQRGVGKTTSLVQYLLEKVKNDQLSSKILYIPADHFLISNTSLYEIAEQFESLGGELIAFDEIHKYDNWSKELKSIVDTFPKLQVIASGSSALKVQKGTHDLSRRAIVYSIKGMSFREHLEIELNISLPCSSLEYIINNHEKLCTRIIGKVEAEGKKVLAEFRKYLRCGYYPYFLEIQDLNTFYLTLEQNLHATIESDLVAIYPALTGNSIKKINQLLQFIAASVPFTPNWQNLKKILEIGDERTLKTYFKYLEDAGLIRSISRYSEKIRRLELPEKVYLDNTNQYYALSSSSSNVGTVRETFFLAMLLSHDVSIPAFGDFILSKKYVFEVGGKNKTFQQIKNENDSYLACDDIEIGMKRKIPLWLFGFLY